MNDHNNMLFNKDDKVNLNLNNNGTGNDIRTPKLIKLAFGILSTKIFKDALKIEDIYQGSPATPEQITILLNAAEKHGIEKTALQHAIELTDGRLSKISNKFSLVYTQTKSKELEGLNLKAPEIPTVQNPNNQEIYREADLSKITAELIEDLGITEAYNFVMIARGTDYAAEIIDQWLKDHDKENLIITDSERYGTRWHKKNTAAETKTSQQNTKQNNALEEITRKINQEIRDGLDKEYKELEYTKDEIQDIFTHIVESAPKTLNPQQFLTIAEKCNNTKTTVNEWLKNNNLEKFIPGTEEQKTVPIILDVIDGDTVIDGNTGIILQQEESKKIKEEYKQKQESTIKERKNDPIYYDNYCTQLGLCNYIRDHLKDIVLHDKASDMWYIKDNDGFCYIPSRTNGYAEIAAKIEEQLTLLRSPADENKQYNKARKFCNKINISQSIDLASVYLDGRPDDIAYVFDEGITLSIKLDPNGIYEVEKLESPTGLKTQYRVNGEFWEGTIEDCPYDFREWLNGYGSPEFIKCLIRSMARPLICRPDKICFQLTSEAGNTGKSTLTEGLMGSWGKHCYTRIEAKEVMTKNQTGRRTALLQAMQKPFTVLNEAEGRIDEGTYKEVVDTSPTFSGNYCGRDRVEVQRRSQIFIESNNLIRASNTSAYSNRTYPIEFTNTFPMDDRIQTKIRGKWQKYARGIMIHELREYVAALNTGAGIEEQLSEICPQMAEDRIRLTQAQDYKQSMIKAVFELSNTEQDAEPWDFVYGEVRNFVIKTGKEIPEWEMYKNQTMAYDSKTGGKWVISNQAKKNFNKTLRQMKFDVIRQGEKKETWVTKIRKSSFDE